MKIKFLGGTKEVTGSCFYLEINNLRILIECGMHQGNGSEELNASFDFKPAEIDYIFLTHAHLDHSGLIPKMVKEGFRGRILTTSATKDLLEIMLCDSARIQEADAEWSTKKALRRGMPPVKPLYTVNDVSNVMPLFEIKPYGKIFHLRNGINYRFLDAGHILGSACIEICFYDSEKEKKIIFSGDIGKKGNPIIKDPEYLHEADFIVMEGTYGNRTHKSLKQSIDEFVDAIKNTFRKGGNVYIPSFAVGRTQDILYILNNLIREGRLHKIHVYLDSPLAREATEVYIAHPECFDEEARRLFTTKSGGDALHLHFVKTVKESMALNRIRSGIIVIAGSGMCEGGRIRHHLKHNLWREECGVIFVGYQAEGTLGRKIIDGAKMVRILDEDIAVKASIYTINGFSAHADRDELLEWLKNFNNSPEIFLVHGEENILREFKDFIAREIGLPVTIPERGETFEL